MNTYIQATHFLIIYLAIGQAYFTQNQKFTDYSYPTVYIITNYSFVNDIDDHNAYSNYHTVCKYVLKTGYLYALYIYLFGSLFSCVYRSNKNI